MAIERISAPSSLPVTAGDYQAQNALLDVLAIAGNLLIPFSSGSVKKGSVFNIGGVLYKAVSDTTITGALSPYVKITASGATATATYRANLTGVTWNDTYNGYYDGSDLVVFDENLALRSGAVSVAKTKIGLGAKPVGELGNSTIVKLTTPGAGTWTVPAGVFKIAVTMAGGGGGGGAGGFTGSEGGYGGGGGGGGGTIISNALKEIISVTPGAVIPYTVGAGGAGSFTAGLSGNGGAGGSSLFAGATTRTGGGGGYWHLSYGLGGAGASVSGSPGGGGGKRDIGATVGGPGGSGGGSGGVGAFGTASTTALNGSVGDYGGGGGGGGGTSSSDLVYQGHGGSGGPGIIIIEY